MTSVRFMMKVLCSAAVLLLVAVALIAGTAYVAIYQWRWVVNQVMAWLSPPAAPPA